MLIRPPSLIERILLEKITHVKREREKKNIISLGKV
jgi:hypothetical protein